MTSTSVCDCERFVTVRRIVSLPAYRGWLTEASMRHLIFASKPRLNSKGDVIPTNGLDKAIIKIGRKVLIDLIEFDAWVNQQRISTPA